MKRILFFMLLAVLLAGCAATGGNRLSKAELRQQVAQQVKEQLDKRYYKIAVGTMHPQGYPSKHLSSDFSLEVHGDSLISYLPYMGRAYRVPYGGGKALNFRAVLSGYQENYPKKDLRRIQIAVHNDEDQYQYILEIFSNGKATIHVQSYNRDFISFDGEVEL